MFRPLTRLASLFHRPSASIKLDANYRQRATDFVLERARSMAADIADSETMFSVDIPHELQGEYLPSEVVGAVMLHAREHGVELQYAYNWTFYFRRYNDAHAHTSA